MKNNHLIGYVLALASISTPSHALFVNGVASGDVTQNSAVIWAHSSKKETDGSITITFKYSTDPSFGTLAGSQTVVQNSYIEPAKLTLTGLQPSTTYYYRAEDSLGKFLDGKFKTLPASDAQPRLKFGVLDDVRRSSTVFPNNLAGMNNDFNIAAGSFAPFNRHNLSTYLSSINLPGVQASLHEALKNTDGVANTLTSLRRSAAVFHSLYPLDIGLSPLTAGGEAPSTNTSEFDQTGNFINETKRFKEGVLAFQQYTPMEAINYGATGDTRTADKTKLYRHITYGKTATVIMVDRFSFRDKVIAAAANPTDPAQVQQFLINAYASGRTVLGAQQLADLKADLLAAQQNGVKWKFVQGAPMMQNIGPLNGGESRYEGYAAERNELLAFIEANAIKNVVFITTGFEGMWVNDLSYQDALGGPQKSTNSFDINVGSVSSDRQLTSSLLRSYTFGNALAEFGIAAGLINAPQAAFYDSLPVAPDTDSALNDKDDFIKAAINGSVLAPLGYNALGLQGSTINATLLEGDYVHFQKNTWATFDINPSNLVLTVTVFGADSIAKTALIDPQAAKRTPISVVSKFKVLPK